MIITPAESGSFEEIRKIITRTGDDFFGDSFVEHCYCANAIILIDGEVVDSFQGKNGFEYKRSGALPPDILGIAAHLIRIDENVLVMDYDCLLPEISRKLLKVGVISVRFSKEEIEQYPEKAVKEFFETAEFLCNRNTVEVSIRDEKTMAYFALGK